MHVETGNNSERTPTPVPWGRVLVVCALLVVNHLSLVMIFPFLPFMVHRFFPQLSTDQLGYRAGFLASAFNVGAFFGSLAWGHFSDRFGRRPALILGVVGTFVSVLAFGFSPSFTVAIVARFLWGLLNGNVGVSKTYLSEICDDTNQSQGYAAIGLSSSIGRLLGPLIGGFLYDPVAKYPSVFGGSKLLESFPYLLPCLFACSLCVISFIVGWILLDETLKPESATTKQRNNTASSVQSPFLQKDVLLSILLYGIFSFSMIMVEEIFPLWAVLSPSDGGLGFTSNKIGIVLTICGPFQLFSQVFVYDRWIRMLGPMNFFKISVIIAGITYALIPYTTYLTRLSNSDYIVWPVLQTLFTVMLVFRVFAFTTVFMFVGNSCLPEVRGRVNGVGQAVASFARAIGPTLGGSLFAWSASNSMPWPLDISLTFSFQALIAFVILWITFQLPSDIERQKRPNTTGMERIATRDVEPEEEAGVELTKQEEDSESEGGEGGVLLGGGR